MGALDFIVRSGRALYAGISSYNAEQTRAAAKIMKSFGTPVLIHQPVYSMFNRWIEDGLTDVLEDEGIGCIVFSPLAQGLLTNKYLKGIPVDSRAGKPHGFLRPEHITDEAVEQVRRLNEIAAQRGQTLAQMAIAWVLRLPAVTSALVGTSRPEQVDDCVNALNNLDFSTDELDAIEAILKE
jgi:L-glyceraldehyde 3-phosphate reductase